MTACAFTPKFMKGSLVCAESCLSDSLANFHSVHVSTSNVGSSGTENESESFDLLEDDARLSIDK